MPVKEPIKIGFDLDGVILYNPARIIRPLIALLKKSKIIQRKQLQFFVPKTESQKLFWKLFHKSSLFVSPAIKDIEELVKDGVIEAYIITARFSHLEKDTNQWFRKFSKKNIFKNYFMNNKDEQPHLFKERKINELKLDYFVEDNWDIVNYLSSKNKSTKFIWITNLIDNKINFKDKFFSLEKFTKTIKSKKKILFLTDYYLPHWTGLSKSLNLMINAVEDVANCSVLTIKHQANLPSVERLNNHLIYRSNYLFSISRAKFSPQLILSYLSLINQHEVIVINSPFTFVFPLSLLAKVFRKQIFIFHQGDLILPNSIFNKFLEAIFNIFTFLAFSLANGLATYTEDYAHNSRILKYFLNKTTSFIVPFPMNNKVTKKLPKVESLRKKHKNIIGLSGRFVEEKGFDLLFSAIPNLKSNNVHFVFAGEKNMGYENFFERNNNLYQKVKSKITFLGLLQGKELESFYHSIDALVMPSRSDCFGLVQVEAMKYEKPVIVTDIIGARDVVSRTNFGELAISENFISLASKIDKYLENKNKYKKYLPKVKKYFDFEKNKNKLKNWLVI